VRTLLARLQAERGIKETLAELGDDRLEIAELDEEIAEAVHAYTVIAVTEIASLRGELSGRQVG
jgi:hypothetical protein